MTINQEHFPIYKSLFPVLRTQTTCNAIGIKPPVTKATIDKYTEDIAVDGSLIQKELGYIPQYDLKTGWEKTIREMQV